MDQDLADIAIVGMAVMGQNLSLNMSDHGFKVVVFNRTVSKVDDFLANQAKDSNIIGADSAEEMVAKLKKPRRVMLMVKAGQAVDEMIEHILPYLEAGDIIIDGGNTQYLDTIRRLDYLKSKGILYIGAGISGGEEGARHGPSIMPGGSAEAWPHLKDIFQAIAAKGSSDLPCCEWIGEGGAGHYVKMVHNGIEYGDMQLICEAYQLLKDLGGLNNEQMSKVFSNWNRAELDSYLIEITAIILDYKDEAGNYVIDYILDTAGQKGTGRWTVIDAAELGQPTTVIAEAMFARSLSALKHQRLAASKTLVGSDAPRPQDVEGLIEDIRKALYVSKLVSYAQGFMQMQAASVQHDWHLNYGEIAQMWTAGCIIRSRFLGDIKQAYNDNPDLANLLLSPFFSKIVKDNQSAWRRVVALGVESGIPLPVSSAALAFYDGYRSSKLPANLLQAQRDCFGAHTYERIDKPRGEFFHTNWTGEGGTTASSSYTA